MNVFFHRNSIQNNIASFFLEIFFFNLDNSLDSGSFSAGTVKHLLEMTCYVTYFLKSQSDNLGPIEMRY